MPSPRLSEAQRRVLQAVVDGREVIFLGLRTGVLMRAIAKRERMKYLRRGFANYRITPAGAEALGGEAF